MGLIVVCLTPHVTNAATCRKLSSLCFRFLRHHAPNFEGARAWSIWASVLIISLSFLPASLLSASGTAALTSPTPGSTLPGSAVTFSWTAVSSVVQYQLWVGTNSGADNLGLCAGTATTCQLSGLPTNGSAVYVSLYWDIAGAWAGTRYTYKAASTAANAASSPPSLTGLSCASGSMAGAGTDSCTVTLSTAAASGGFAVSLASNSSAVTVPATVNVAAGATSAGFSATVSSVSTAATVTLTASAGTASKTFALQLGAASPTLSINATSIAFGDVNLNSPATQTVTLSSTGTAPVTVSAATVLGTGFTLLGATLPVTLSPNQAATLTVQFDPTTAGAASGTLTIVSTSLTNPTDVISLSGTGESTAYEVKLTWVAPSSPSVPITGYNVYRAPSGSTSYQQINTALVTQTAYTDASVQDGQTYDYTVESVAASDATSAPSSMASVTTP